MNILKIEEYFSNKLPKSYIDFILTTDGGIFNDILLYSSDDLIERNECFETKEYTPGWVTIGDNGGGIAIMLKFNEVNPPVYAVDHGSMDTEDFELIDKSFKTWISSGFKF
ncbi:SMI1/KNR4 family protein [Photobacterium kishitanii]|uniref:SMI1/KNR4 family protein n=1 Tax=Photobacterium kishitanii TaxID=318456 RepID=UPI000D15A153|nr:SMI1/KNR4 family protein [Photobacterium kishitanii]PSU87753.1 SMI1/KNR4 family protein [Photobacterium kishitanii]